MKKRTSKRSSSKRGDAASRPAPEPAAPVESAPERGALLVATTALSAALAIASSFFPATRLWGINHLAFLPPAIRLVLIALLALSFVPAVARACYRGALAASDGLAASRKSPGALVAFAAFAIFSISIFYSCRSATLLLGDGQLITQSFEAAEEGHKEVIMRSAHAIMTEETIAPGATLLYYGAIKVMAPFKRPPLTSMRILNCVLGGLFVFVFLLAASSRVLSRDSRVWLVILGLFSSSLLLFYGYIENYTAPLLFLVIYVIMAFRAIHRLSSPWLALIPLACAIYSHVHCILFIPSFVYLLLWLRARNRRATILRLWTPLFMAIAVVGVLSVTFYIPIRRFYVPLGFDNAKYALFSPTHLVDVMNEVLILLPILPTVLALGWIGRRAERAGGRDPIRDPRALKDPGAWFSHPAEWQFAGTVLFPCVLYIVLFHPEIGMARDWDLFAMTSTAIVPLAILSLNRYLRTTGAGLSTVAAFATPALVTVMITGSSWVAVNASLPRTVDRFQRILTYDKTHAPYAWENLAILQHDRGELKASIASLEKAVAISHNPRQIVRLAVYTEEDGRINDAIDMLDKVLEKRPDFSKARFRLVLFLEKTEQWDRLLTVSRDGVKYSPGDAVYRFTYGESLLRLGRTDEALTVFRECRNLDLPDTVKQFIESALAQAGSH